MPQEIYVVIAFASTHHAIAAEKQLQEACIQTKIIPVPAEIEAGCGFAIRISPIDTANSREILNYGNYYKVVKNGTAKEINRI